jgi:GTP-binding protein Era
MISESTKMSENKKSGFVTIIGRPNVGKSTLMNHLIGQKIAITSNKPQTTRKRIQTVYTDKRGQIVFLDTPGMNKAYNRLGEYMSASVESAIAEVDVILWLVEPDPFIGPGDKAIAEKLSAREAPVVLIINKTDTVAKEKIAETITAYEKLGSFEKIVSVSALRSVNTAKVLDAIYDLLPEGPQYYSEDTVTEIPLREIVAEIIREKALRCLRDEVPHGIAVEIDSMKERGDLFDIDATIICEKDSHKGIIIGKGGTTLKKIGTLSRVDAEEVCGCRVNLKLFVKVRKEWRDDPLSLRSFGYDIKDLK